MKERSYLQSLEAVQSLKAVLSEGPDHVVMKMPKHENIIVNIKTYPRNDTCLAVYIASNERKLVADEI